MARTISLSLLALFILAVVVMINLPEEKIDFIFAQNAVRCQTPPGTKAEPAGDFIRLTRLKGDMFIVVQAMNIDADWYDVGEIEQRVPAAYDAGHLLFTSPFNNRFDFNFRHDFDTGPADKLNKRYINLKGHGAWQGMVRDILIIPAATAGKAEIRSIRFIHANPWTKIKAGWSEFVRYSDPKLGSCFAMASPFFINTGFSLFFLPFFWWLLAGGLVVYFIRLDRRIKKYTAIGFFIIFLFVWGMLDARNNIYYLKGISRDRNLYWGKALTEKRGIVTGDPKFAEFMKFCDENIPMDARTFNLVSKSPRETPPYYLQGTQFRFQLRPRLNGIYQFSEDFPKAYYIVYQTDPKELKEVDHDQWVVNQYINLSKNEIIRQNVLLWNKLEDMAFVKLKLKKDERIAKDDLSVEILSESGDKILATGSLTRIATFESLLAETFAEPIFKINVLAPYEKSRVILQIKNKRDKIISIGYSRVQNPYTHGYVQSRNEGLFYKGKLIKGELAFTSEYLIKNPKLFKQYSEDAYIFTK